MEYTCAGTRLMFESGWRFKLLLLWLSGISLRLTVLAVPPLLPRIHQDLHLDESAIGFLTGIPVLLVALAAVPGSLLIAKLGPRRALMLSLTVIALAGAARSLGSSPLILFSMTFVMGCGIAAAQPAMPSLVKAWVSERVGLGTGSFSNGILIGEIVAVAATLPLVVPLFNGDWSLALASWSIPVIVTVALIALFSSHEVRSSELPRLLWWPDWHDPRIWKLGLILGGASSAYWTANAFIPEYLRISHEGSLTTLALTTLNVVQLPSSILVALLPRWLIGRRWPLAGSGVLTIITATGIAILPGGWVVVAAGLLGFSTAMVFVLTLALPPVLSASTDTHRLSAGIFTIAYVCPFLGSLLGGVLWDSSGMAWTAFAPLFIGGCLMLALPVGLNLTATHGSSLEEDRFHGADVAL